MSHYTLGDASSNKTQQRALGFMLCCIWVLIQSCTPSKVHAEQEWTKPRFDFAENLRQLERFENRYRDRIIINSSDLERKAYRLEQIEGIRDGRPNYPLKSGRHVTVLFDVTDDIPQNFDLQNTRKSIAQQYITLLKSQLTAEQQQYTKIAIVSKPEFASSQRHQRYFEKIDLYVTRSFIKPIIDHPNFVDITFAGISSGIAFRTSPDNLIVWLTETERSFTYSDQTLRRGYIQEIVESFEFKDVVKLHIHIDEMASLDRVLQTLEKSKFELIRSRGNEALLAVDRSSAEQLFSDPNVTLLKDYEFHRELDVAHGRWKPAPLSEVRDATGSEITPIPFSSRLDEYNQTTQVFETAEQLSVFLDSLNQKRSKEVLKTAIEAHDIDFSTQNLLLYSQQESSGSTLLKQQPPIWVDDKLVVTIDRYLPAMQTADMAAHFFAYSVDKKIPAIAFHSGAKSMTVENKAETN